MAVFKRGKYYYYGFWWRGRFLMRSTRQSNPRVARQMEAAHRTALAKGEVGLVERKPVPKLRDFCAERFEPWARANFEKSSPKTWVGWYRNNLRAALRYRPLAERRLDEITGEHIADFAAHRQAEGLRTSSVNRSLQLLRRVLRLAVEWGVIGSAPKVKLLRGEQHRERVVGPEEEARYLVAAPEPVASVAAVLVDTGLRPEECFRLRWEAISWLNGRYGTLLVTHGKTAAARRLLPMTTRVRAILEARWQAAGKPEEGWTWPAPTRSGHIEPSTLKKQHYRALRESKVRPFVLYSLRHTFLTRLAMSGCDAWTLARIAGHSSIAISSRYVHPNEDAVLSAMSRLDSKRSIQEQVGPAASKILPA